MVEGRGVSIPSGWGGGREVKGLVCFCSISSSFLLGNYVSGVCFAVNYAEYVDALKE